MLSSIAAASQGVALDTLLADARNHTDQSLKQMVDALQAAGLYDSTAIVITAKHGETPLDPPRTIVLTSVIPNLITTVAAIVGVAGMIYGVATGILIVVNREPDE